MNIVQVFKTNHQEGGALTVAVILSALMTLCVAGLFLTAWQLGAMFSMLLLFPYSQVVRFYIATTKLIKQKEFEEKLANKYSFMYNKFIN